MYYYLDMEPWVQMTSAGRPGFCARKYLRSESSTFLRICWLWALWRARARTRKDGQSSLGPIFWGMVTEHFLFSCRWCGLVISWCRLQSREPMSLIFPSLSIACPWRRVWIATKISREQGLMHQLWTRLFWSFWDEPNPFNLNQTKHWGGVFFSFHWPTLPWDFKKISPLLFPLLLSSSPLCSFFLLLFLLFFLLLYFFSFFVSIYFFSSSLSSFPLL